MLEIVVFTQSLGSQWTREILGRKRDPCSAQRRAAQIHVAVFGMIPNVSTENVNACDGRLRMETAYQPQVDPEAGRIEPTKSPLRPYHYNCVDEPNVASGKDCRVAGVC